MKQKQESLMDAAKDTIKLGVVSNTGMFAVGTIGKIAGPAATPVTGAVGAGLALANVGRLAKTGMTLTNQFDNQTKTQTKTVTKKKPKSFAEDKISRILG